MHLTPFDSTIWTGRIDIEDGELGNRIHQIIKPYNDLDTASKVLVGFSSEEGVNRNKGRLGAKEAPDSIRKALANLPLHFSNQKIFDNGNINVETDLEAGRDKQIEIVTSILNQNNFPIVIGGGHETALGNFLAFIQRYPQNSVVINIDAHFDIRIPTINSTSGTPFYEMKKYCEDNKIEFNYLAIGIQELGNTKALFNRADEIKAEYIIADELHANFNRVLDEVKIFTEKFENIYITLDMDVFDVAYAPGVSATTINGLTPFQVKYLLILLKKSNKVKIFDIVEVNPTFDRDNQTSKLAAHMIYELLRD
ncbi:MAG: formimidoylglutamase [Weeksellaceae bacterium]|nr:formimidoylglutamase [Weeksellaceae bacterium]